MFVVVILSILLAAALTASGIAKLRRAEPVVASMQSVHFPLDRLWMLACLEFAASAGLIVGLWWWPIGVAAGIGAVAYFVGALVFHYRAKAAGYAPAASLMVLGAAVAVLQASLA